MPTFPPQAHQTLPISTKNDISKPPNQSNPVDRNRILRLGNNRTQPNPTKVRGARIRGDRGLSAKLVELESYCTLIRPKDLSAVALRSSRCDGITREGVKDAPFFEDVAEKIFGILNGRIWAGHNIRRFDCVRIKEAFEEIGKPAPVPVGMIDSLGVLTEKFGRRAGNMKMATLATYFGLGQQKHRSLDDVRMNLEVLKHCATVLFLESSLPGVLNGTWPHSSPTVTTRSRSILDSNIPSVSNGKWEGYPSITTRSRRNIGKFPCREENSRKSPPNFSFLSKSCSLCQGQFRKDDRKSDESIV